ncbi:MAG: glycine betaine/proline transport system ATP-binding protein [Granulosicoccus sp.]|jgi:glycine betaine/proline transport system ATP-binding protein
MTNAVEFDNVSIVFGDTPQQALPLMDEMKDRADVQLETGQILGVHNCSVNVADAEILVLMGLSGSGKSTLLRAVNGLNSVVRGSVRVNNNGEMVDITNAHPKLLRHMRQHQISMVFQQFGLLPWRTVRENVSLGLELGGMAKTEKIERVDRQLELVHLNGWAERKVGELSGGMQQRVGLARAFVTDAPILLMDEPFSALDPLIRTRLQDELLDLQRDLKRTIIFVSHDLDEAFKLGDRIAIMEGGRIVQCGTPQEIYTNPINDYVSEFVAHMNPLGVLCARNLAEPTTETPLVTVNADANIREVMAKLDDSTQVIGVVDADGLIGQISKDRVLAKLVDPRT